MDVNFHIVYDDLSEQAGTITLEQVAQLLASLIAKQLTAQTDKANISEKANRPVTVTCPAT